jgi:NAD(P)-dependent dehydrogenase (short-subunit alcohol dehydrogenase family)
VRVLVLGGTSFVGRAIVEDALRTGADVTLFGRGKTGTDLFPGLTRLIGDRDTGDYAALGTDHWDAVVDVSGYVPRHVGQAMDALGDRAGRYLFISSHAVYQHAGVGPGCTEDTPRRPPVRDTEELSDLTYGPLKVACEDDVVRGNWPSQQRCPARARAAGMPATPLEVTVADVLAWDRQRGEPPLTGGFTEEQERTVLAHHDRASGA